MDGDIVRQESSSGDKRVFRLNLALVAAGMLCTLIICTWVGRFLLLIMYAVGICAWLVASGRVRLKKLLASWGVLLLLSPGCCCCTSYMVPPLDLFYLSIVGDYYYDIAMSKIPEFDRLNNELMAKLPKYPGSQAIPGLEHREGPANEEFLRAPTWPRILHVCYKVDAPKEQIFAFYKQALPESDWKLVREQKWWGARDWYADFWFAKHNACVIIDNCWLWDGDWTDQDGATVYQISIFYELNQLLGFPGIPRQVCQE